MRKFNTGDRVIVRWETGIVETGTVAGETAPIRGESESFRLVDLELDDRTRCTAPASRVERIVEVSSEDLRIPNVRIVAGVVRDDIESSEQWLMICLGLTADR